MRKKIIKVISFIKSMPFVLAIILPYIFIFIIHCPDRKQYQSELQGNIINKINLISDYQSIPSLVVSKDGKFHEFYCFFGDKASFAERVHAGDRVFKAAGTFDFIVMHSDSSCDSLFHNTPWYFRFIFMPHNRIFKTNCPCNTTSHHIVQ